jgi:protein transport protein SEC23
VVFVLDESLDLDESRLMRGSVARALDALPDGTRVGLVAFAGAVSAYDVQTDAGLGFDGGDFCFAAASVVPGHRSPDARDLSAILDEKRGGPSRCIARLGDEGVRETLAAIVASLAPVGNKRREGAARTRPRSFGAAVETAVAVLDGASARDAGTRDAKNADTASRGRVIVCLGGPPTRGPGAAAADEQSEFYDAEERAARAYVETLAETVRFFFFSRDNPFPFGVTETFSARVSPRVSSRTVTPPRGRLDPLGDVLLA